VHDAADCSLPRGTRRRLPAFFFLSALLCGILLVWTSANGDLPAWRIRRVVLIHAAVYGMTFGLTMPSLGPRIFAVRPPRSWIILVSTLALFSTIASWAIGVVLATVEPSRSLPFWRGFAIRTLMGSLVSCTVGAAIAATPAFKPRSG
jgi:hypothetical protein